MCYAANFGYAMFSGDGTLFIEREVKSSNFFALGQAIYRALKGSKPHFTVKHRGKELLISLDLIHNFTQAVMECVFNTEWISPVDGDVLKHAISHPKTMVL